MTPISAIAVAPLPMQKLLDLTPIASLWKPQNRTVLHGRKSV